MSTNQEEQGLAAQISPHSYVIAEVKSDVHFSAEIQPLSSDLSLAHAVYSHPSPVLRLLVQSILTNIEEEQIVATDLEEQSFTAQLLPHRYIIAAVKPVTSGVHHHHFHRCKSTAVQT